MKLGLDGRRALVLGSSSGLGLAVAADLAAEGAAVVVHGRDADRLEAAATTVGATAAVAADLTTPGEAERLVGEASEALGGLDVLVVNTGGGMPGGILDSDSARELAAYQSMLQPALEAARAAAGHLRRSPQARMIFLTARSVVAAEPDLALSGVFRSGVVGAARSLAVELAPAGVCVNVIVTGQFDTPGLARFEAWRAEHDDVDLAEVRVRHERRIVLGRVGEPGELAAVVTFLCSARASFVTGAVIPVDGGRL